MSKTSGTAEQILSLPKGGGSIRGLGEKFQPDLHTGTGSYAIPLDIPNGPNDIAPKITLLYHTDAGNGPFGMGFSFNTPTMSRSYDKQIPAYRDDDLLILMGGEELVHIGEGKYRPKIDTKSWQIEREGEGFRLTDREGKYYRLGINEQARLFIVEHDFKKIFSWHLEEIEDPLGNKAAITYRRDSNQLYIEKIDYSIYTVRFEYEERPDPIISGRAGFLITTRLRCSRIELLLNISSNPLIRRWELEYIQSDPGGHSLLSKVKLTGFDETGQTASLPELTMNYTEFHPRRLDRFKAEVPDAFPGAFLGGQRELIDWDGDGLPDLLEMVGGRARVWHNLGDYIWGKPRSLGPLPTPIALGEPGVAFADMEGNGTADLIMLDRPLAGYYPHLPGGEFGRPVFWHQTPGINLSDPNARLVDLNGDGITDLLVTGENYFSLYYRQSNNGWQEMPHTIPRPHVPPVSLSDPRIHLADMNGDGLQDIVRVDGAGVTYWPYLGNGRWGDPITLKNPPTLPPRFDPKRMFLNDIDGDGCSDLIYVDFNRVIYWLNQSGTRLSDSHEISYTPPASVEQIRLADMKGTGTSGVLWSYIGPGSRTTDYFYLDFTGGVKPYLLNRIDNGMGLFTEIEYGTSTAEAVRDRKNGTPWTTFLPFPVPVVTTLRITDKITHCQSSSRYSYHNGHFDGISREFAGFSMVDEYDSGDDAIPETLIRNWHHIGLDPTDPARSLSELDRTRLKALRGKLLKTEIYGLDGNPDQDKPHLRTENNWGYRVEEIVNFTEFLFPYLVESRTLYFEREVNPYRMEITRNLAFDANGNITEQEQHTEDPRDPSLSRNLYTTVIFVNDPSERIIGKPAKVIQRDDEGQIVASTISYYDGLPEGGIGAQGLLTSQETLVLTDEIVSEVYGIEPPDFISLGYHRRSGEHGWWIFQLNNTRIDDTNGLRIIATNAKGYTNQIFFDEYKIHPMKVVDHLGNSTEALYDYRANKLQSLTDNNGSTSLNNYDPLGRLICTIEPGASKSYPTTQIIYNVDKIPFEVITLQRAVNGLQDVISNKLYLDGSGQVIEERVLTEEGEIVEQTRLFSVRGSMKTQSLPFLAIGPDYILSGASMSRRRFRYDALGRLIEVINPDSSIQRQFFEPGVTFLHDEEDTQTQPAVHANTPIRYTYDQTGRIKEVALNDSGRWIPIQYKYDIKGNIIEVVNSVGRRTEFSYDLLGHRLRTYSPDSRTSLFIFDPNGNMIERRDARGEIVHLEFDELDRLKCVSSPHTGEVFSEYIYHDILGPEPNDAGKYTKGRVIKVTHQAGEELFDYDEIGNVIRRIIRINALPGQELIFDSAYRADGQISSVTYPPHSPADERLQVRYEYDRSGRLSTIPNFIRKFDYNLAGQRTRTEFENDVVTTYDYDPLTLRLKQLLTKDGLQAILQQFQYDYDKVGNLLRVSSPDSKRAAIYGYDDLYRLLQATMQSGEKWNYQYDDLGNLLFKSDIGYYNYDINGLLVSAGTSIFTNTPDGRLKNAHWGESDYDSIGRLRSIVKEDKQMTCSYDHNGHRVRMMVTGNSFVQDIFSPNDLISIENGEIYAHLFDNTERIAQVRLDTGDLFFLHKDHLGSTTLVTGYMGEVLQKIYYDPFGGILENNISTTADITRFLYTGHIRDVWSELYYFRSRYYDPQIGRFLTPDTLVQSIYNPLAWNRYSYVRNNPTCLTDPTGHSWKYMLAALTIGVVAALTVASAGTLAPLLGVTTGWIYAGVATGAVIGGTVGAISASRGGGDPFLGFLTGMAIGGASALLGMSAAAGMTSLLGAKSYFEIGLGWKMVAGGLAGSINWSTNLFMTGTAGKTWDKILTGALIGVGTGAILGAITGWGPDNFKLFEAAKATRYAVVWSLGIAASFSGLEIIRQKAVHGIDADINWGRVAFAGSLGLGIGLATSQKVSDWSQFKDIEKIGENLANPLIVGVSIITMQKTAIYELNLHEGNFWEFLTSI